MQLPILLGSIALLAVVLITAALLGAKAASATRRFNEEDHVPFNHRITQKTGSAH